VTERRSRWLLVLVLAGQLVLLSLQAPGSSADQSLLETVTLRAVAPLGRVVFAGGTALDAVREWSRSRSALQTENEILRRRVRALEEERIRFFDLEGRLERLEAAVRYQPPGDGSVRPVDVVHVDYGNWFQTMILYVGASGARFQQPVLTADGVIGRVTVVAGPYAKVQLIIDRAASVGAMNERTRRQGIVRGGEGVSLEMDFVPLQADVRIGDRIVTAGIDGVYPRGLPLGEVVSVEPGNELFYRIRLTPTVDFGQLDQVFLLETEPVAEELLKDVDARP
jgi:rod shape-determining protein MreC